MWWYCILLKHQLEQVKVWYVFKICGIVFSTFNSEAHWWRLSEMCDCNTLRNIWRYLFVGRIPTVHPATTALSLSGDERQSTPWISRQLIRLTEDKQQFTATFAHRGEFASSPINNDKSLGCGRTFKLLRETPQNQIPLHMHVSAACTLCYSNYKQNE